MHKRQRLIDGGYLRTSDDDNSSSGCSSAGPGALRNMMPSPISPNGRSLNGSLYGRPSPTDEQQLPMNRMLSSSRYLPYTIRPLVVRAKRKLQSDSSVHVTSTAQRIINALDNVSTPVVNSVKVPYEPLLNSRPVFTPIRRDTQGPPIMKSPIVPSSKTKILFNPTIHIPRMVDFGTNTDMSMSAFNMDLHSDDLNPTARSSGGGKMKSNISSRMHAPPLKHNFALNVPALPDIQNHFKPAVATKYKFSRAWSSNELKGMYSKKAATRERLNKTSQFNASTSGNITKAADEPIAKKMSIPTKPLTTFNNPNAPKGWECPSCMVSNKAEATACVCCATKNPKGESLKPKPAVKTWECPDCMVPNKAEAEACVCCGHKNAAASAKPVAGGKAWDCPTCMVPNKAESTACVCCGEKNPSRPTSSTAPATPPKPAFQFGFSTPKNETSVTKASSSSTFAFGAPKDTSTPKSTFTFGVKPDTAPANGKVTSTSPPKGSFNFGFKPSNSSNTNRNSESTVTSSADISKTFAFGAANNTPTKPPISPITFGLPAEPSAATAIKSSPIVPSKSPEASKATVPLRTSEKLPAVGQPNNVFGSFTFGATKTTMPSPNKVSLIKPEEMWQCGRCPAKNRLSVSQCIGCGNSRVTDTKPQGPSVKRFQFEPFFGGKTDDKVDSRSSPEPELKRKIPNSGGLNSASTFGSGSTSSSTGFMYTPPAEPTLKLKSTPEAPPVTKAAEMKSGSFLDALKSGSQFTFAAPAPGATLIPTGAASSSSVPATVSSATSVPSNSLVSSTSNNSTSGPPSGLFQFGVSSSTSSNNVNHVSSTPSMGLPTNNNALSQSTFSFGGSGGLKNGPLSSSSSAAPSVFGSPLSTIGSSSSPAVFGSPAPLGNTASPAPTNNPAPAPSFNFSSSNLTPNFNFGGTAAPSGSFVFSAPPSASPGGPGGDGGMGGRKIRKATRRMNR